MNMVAGFIVSLTFSAFTVKGKLSSCVHYVEGTSKYTSKITTIRYVNWLASSHEDFNSMVISEPTCCGTSESKSTTLCHHTVAMETLT